MIQKKYIYFSSIFTAILLAGVFFVGNASAQVSLSLQQGELVKAVGNSSIYYIDDGVKRLIASEEAFVAQGFKWDSIRTVSADALDAYPAGEAVTADTMIILPNEYARLPDLVPLATTDFRIAVQGGQKILRFTSMFWNKGGGDFELQIGGTSPPDEHDHQHVSTLQKITRTNGEVREKVVGDYLFHPLHDHYHYDNFSHSSLELLQPLEPASLSAPKVVKKITFCLRDDVAIDTTISNAKNQKKYWGCSNEVQGVSVGWADRYGYDLPDQSIDITGLPHGIYAFTFDVDPLGAFAEQDKTNNQSVALLELDPDAGSVRVIASGAPYETANNQYPDGTLLKTADSPRVYVTLQNKKRWIPNETTFESYGYGWGNIYTVPNAVLEAIPDDRFVRVKGSAAVYMINAHGYKRYISDPAVLASYGPPAIAEINRTEFEYYADTDVIQRAGSNRIFSVSKKDYIDSGYDPNRVQEVNAVDLKSYAVEVFAENMSIPWDMVFLPDGDMLVTERTGTLRRLGANPGAIDIPSVEHMGEGGLMGIALHPDFEQNQFVYLYFTTEQDGSKNKIVRFRLNGNTLMQDKVILDNIPAAVYHDGGRIAFGPDGMLYATVGDATNADLAQDVDSLAGKTLRLTPDGGIPADNPFGTAVWSYGHRNAQGIAWDKFGRMWQTEHGRSGALSGFDELNRIQKGGNYGWPIIQGDETQSGMISPIRQSGADTTWAPAGLAYDNDRLFFAGLRGESLYEVTFDEIGEVRDIESHFSEMYGRLRGVTIGPDGYLYVSTSNTDGRGTEHPGDDKILKIHPGLL